MSGSSSDSSSNVVPLAVGLGVGVPCVITVAILIWLYARHRRVSREEDERHENIDIDGDVTLYENNIVEDEKHAVRPKVRRDDSSSFMYTPYFKDPSLQSVDGYSRSMTSVLGPSPFHQSSEMLRSPRSYSASASSMHWQTPPRLPTQPWNDQGSNHNSFASTHTLSSVPSSPGGLESLATDTEEGDGDLSFDATQIHRESVALDDPDFSKVSTVPRNTTPPLTSSAHSARLSTGHRATFGYEGGQDEDPRLSTISFASLQTARSNPMKITSNTQFLDSKTSLAHSSLANEILPDGYTSEQIGGEINDSHEYAGDSFEASAMSDVQVEASSGAMPQNVDISEPQYDGTEYTVPETNEPGVTVLENTETEKPVLELDEPHHVEPGHIEPDHIEPDHIEPDHIEPDHIEPDHIEPDHIEPDHIEPDHIEPDHIEPNHTESGYIKSEKDASTQIMDSTDETIPRDASDLDFKQLPTPETTPAPEDKSEPATSKMSTPRLGPTPETSYDASLGSPWGTNNYFLPPRPPSPANSSAPSSVYPESSISNRYGSSQPSSPQVVKSPPPAFVPTLSDYMDLPGVPPSGGFKPHSSGHNFHSPQKTARPPVPAPRNSIAVLDESVFIQRKRKFGPKSRGKSLPAQYAGQNNYGPH